MNATTTAQGQYSLWQRKLRYLLKHHGCGKAIAETVGVRTTSLERMAAGQSSAKEEFKLESATVRQIEKDLDLPDGWFDATAFLPSSL